MDTKTIFEHWTDAALQERIDNAEYQDAGMLEDVRKEIERRAKVAEDRARIAQQAEAAKRKQQAAEEAERKQRQREKRRAEMIDSTGMLAEARQRLAVHLKTQARVHYGFRGHAEAFIMDALAMATREGRAREIAELLRGTEWAERWSMSHPTDPAIVVYFGDVFPEQQARRKSA